MSDTLEAFDLQPPRYKPELLPVAELHPRLIDPAAAWVEIGRTLTSLIESGNVDMTPAIEKFFSGNKSSLRAANIDPENNQLLQALIKIMKLRSKGDPEATMEKFRQLSEVYQQVPENPLVFSTGESLTEHDLREQLRSFLLLDNAISIDKQSDSGGFWSMLPLIDGIERTLGGHGSEKLAVYGFSKEFLNLINSFGLLFGSSEWAENDRMKKHHLTSEELLALAPLLLVIREKYLLTTEQSAELARKPWRAEMTEKLGLTRSIVGSSMNAFIVGWTPLESQLDSLATETSAELTNLLFSRLPPDATDEQKQEHSRLIGELHNKEKTFVDMLSSREYIETGYIYAELSKESFLQMLDNDQLTFPFVAGIVLNPSAQGRRESATLKIVTSYDKKNKRLICQYGDHETANRIKHDIGLTTHRYQIATDGPNKGFVESIYISGPVTVEETDENGEKKQVEKANIFEVDADTLAYIQIPFAKPEKHHTNPWKAENEISDLMGKGPISFDGLIQQFYAMIKRSVVLPSKETNQRDEKAV